MRISPVNGSVRDLTEQKQQRAEDQEPERRLAVKVDARLDCIEEARAEDGRQRFAVQNDANEGVSNGDDHEEVASEPIHKHPSAPGRARLYYYGGALVDRGRRRPERTRPPAGLRGEMTRKGGRDSYRPRRA